MSPEIKSSSTMPSKGKSKEAQQWQLNWWDAQLLVERDSRPLEWSKSSVLFSAHPSQPLVTARHFSSSKLFLLQSPPGIEGSPGLYRPPSLISVDPDDGWLFAFFPGKETAGIGCMWRKGARIDDWVIKEYWPFVQGAGVVGAGWLGTSRQWASGATPEQPKRLPSRGPSTPMSSPTLVLVTQNHFVHIYYLRQYLSVFRILSCSISRAEITAEGRPDEVKPTRARICTKAAIGLHYNDNSILIATRSYTLPSNSSDIHHFNDLDSNVPELIQPQISDFGLWGEESTLELTDVHLHFNGAQMNLTTDPLPPLVQLSGSIAKLAFISYPRAYAASAPAETHFYLVSSYLDFQQYSSTPKSLLVVHSILRTHNAAQNRASFAVRQSGAKLFSPRLLAFFVSPPPITAPSHDSLLVGVVDSLGDLPSPQSNVPRLPIGKLQSLLLPDLSEDVTCSTTELASILEEEGLNVPIEAAVSPSGVLLVTLSSSFTNQTVVHQMPTSTSSALLDTYLATAINGCTSSEDLVHHLCQVSTTLDNVFHILYCSLLNIQGSRQHLSPNDLLRCMGTISSVYRKRAYLLANSDEEQLLDARWQVAHDICSLCSCVNVFEDLSEGEKYDLDAVWQLIALSTWLVSLVKKIVKECVLFSEFKEKDLQQSPTFVQSSISPTLLHIAHPQTIQMLVSALNHVKQFRNFVGSLSPNAENAQMARDVLLDLIDGSSFDFQRLITVFISSITNLQSLSQVHLLNALARCQPTPDMWPLLLPIINKVTDTAILNKSTLFIQMTDLIDEHSNAPVAMKSSRGKDVILKRVLTGKNPSMVCLRCGGSSEVQADWDQSSHLSPRWRAWERDRLLQCICGGSWSGNHNPH